MMNPHLSLGTKMHVQADTLDDLLHECFERLLDEGELINPTQGKAFEKFGALLELNNPRARLSVTELKAKAFSCLGEALWYLSGSNELDFIGYYISHYKKHTDDGNTLQGAYGPRIFGSQYERLKKKILANPDTRHGIIQIIQAQDLSIETKDVPCTCTLQFAIRNNKLHLLTSMRSNDLYWGTPHDIFCFTLIQEILARDLGVEIGTYKHSVGSLHLYDRHKKDAQEYLEAGWQGSNYQMPEMPIGNPWPALNEVFNAEKVLRTGGHVNLNQSKLDPYWQDLIRLLQVYSVKKRGGSKEELITIRNEIHHTEFHLYVDLKIAEMK